MFDVRRCLDCGRCLELCVYIPLRGEDAVREHRELASGGEAEWVMRYRVGCGACDTFCPNNAHPYSLILDRLHARYEGEGLPARARFLMPTLPGNFHEFLV
nr:hypothetical protein [Candidatus Freyrarchaeum guaymaensis]